MHSFKESKAANQIFGVVSSLATHENFYNLNGEYPIKTQLDTGVHTIHTPLNVVREMVESVFDEQQPNENSSILVLFNVEFVFSLVYNFGIEFKNISFFSDHASKTKLVNSLSDESVEVIIDKEKLMSKKFDFVFGNPPYDGRSSLHQKIFNKVISLVKDNGYVVFIQPASPYQNKNSDDSNDKEMISNVISYKSSVRFYPGTVFEAAQVGTDVAVTTLQKTKSIPVINKLTYKNGNTYLKVKIDDVTLSEFSPEMYSSIFVKFKNICEKLGSLKDNITQDLSKERVFISKGRGHPNSDDFFTIVPKKNSRIHYNDSENFKYGVLIPKKHAENFYDYCESYVARMGLALNKFNVNLAIGGSTKFVPMFDFSRTYTDEELYQMVGLTDEEIIAIENFLPDYYGRKVDNN